MLIIGVVLLHNFERAKLSHDREQPCVESIDPDLHSVLHQGFALRVPVIVL